MKKILLFIILSLFAVNISSCGQSDTLPNDQGKKISSPEGLKKVIDSKDLKFVIVDVRSEIEYSKRVKSALVKGSSLLLTLEVK